MASRRGVGEPRHMGVEQVMVHEATMSGRVLVKPEKADSSVASVATKYLLAPKLMQLYRLIGLGDREVDSYEQKAKPNARTSASGSGGALTAIIMAASAGQAKADEQELITEVSESYYLVQWTIGVQVDRLELMLGGLSVLVMLGLIIVFYNCWRCFSRRAATMAEVGGFHQASNSLEPSAKPPVQERHASQSEFMHHPASEQRPGRDPSQADGVFRVGLGKFRARQRSDPDESLHPPWRQ
eukprot:15447116-Alexandrium_andersonii.AAC.1